MEEYYYKENNGEYPDELQHLVMSNHKQKPVASHNHKETAVIHIEKNNRLYPFGFRTTEERREIILKKYMSVSIIKNR